jgi:4-phytase/acid phosphatase
MTTRAALRLFLLLCLVLLPFSMALSAQNEDCRPAGKDADLQFVLLLSRHGVRPPISTPGQLDKYSAAPWPQWSVPPGYLTAHGYQLMKQFGMWDRTLYSEQGLLSASGCTDAAHVTIVADTDERTRETGKALSEGMLPGCAVPVQSQPDGVVDPLFRSLDAGVGPPDYALASAAISGRIGGDANNLTAAYRPQLTALDDVLAGCGHAQATNPKRTSIFDIPAGLSPGSGGRPATLSGPLSTGSTMAENLLLEYSEGMSDANTGWGCVDGARLRSLMQLNIAGWDYAVRTPAVARMYASYLLDRIEKSMEQRVTGKPVAGAVSKPGDRMLILAGHDTNIAAIAAALDAHWIVDGRVDDTPPGGALAFELWRTRKDGKLFVRLEYTAQTLEQMRQAQTLSAANPPAREPVFVPGCSGADMSCTWAGFKAAMQNSIDPRFVNAQH